MVPEKTNLCDNFQLVALTHQYIYFFQSSKFSGDWQAQTTHQAPWMYVYLQQFTIASENELSSLIYIVHYNLTIRIIPDGRAPLNRGSAWSADPQNLKPTVCNLFTLASAKFSSWKVLKLTE